MDQIRTGVALIMKYSAFLFLMYAAFQVTAENPEAYRKLDSERKENLLHNSGFEQNETHWQGTGKNGWSIVRGEGRNGTNALCKSRAGRGEYTLAGQKELVLKPGVAYEFGGWIKTDRLTGPGAGIAIEWSNAQTGKHLYGAYLPLMNGNHSYQEVKGLLTPRDYGFPVRYQMTLYLHRDSTGKAFFDDLYVRSVSGRWNAAMIYPIRETVTLPGPSLELLCAVDGEFRYPRKSVPHLQCRTVIRRDTDILYDKVLPIKNERVVVKPENLSEGSYHVELQLLDTANKVILGTTSFPMRAVSAEAAGKYRIAVDRSGRIAVKGKYFLPIGIYKHRLTSRSEVDLLLDAGFNTVCVYLGHEIPADIFQYCAERGLWIIPSVGGLMPVGASQLPLHSYRGITDREKMADALISDLRKHDAVLAYYIADEVDSSYADDLKKLRRRIRRLDPERPTFAVYYQNFMELAGCQDMIGIDPYPVKVTGSNEMRDVLKQLREAGRTRKLPGAGGMALWAVPQYSNLGIVAADAKDPAVYLKKYRYPTLTELYSMIALEMIKGARGFIGFNFDFMHYKKTVDPDAFRRFWPVIKKAVAFQREMTDFLLSDMPAIPVRIRTVRGEVHAAAFQCEDGRTALLVASIGPGEAEAVIELDRDPDMMPRFGNLKRQAPGVWHFRGRDIDSALVISGKRTDESQK